MNLRRAIPVLVAVLAAFSAVGTPQPAAAALLQQQVIGAGSTANTVLEIGPAVFTPRRTQVFFCDRSMDGRCPTYDRFWADFIWTPPVSGVVDCVVVAGRTWYGRLAIDPASGDVWSIKVVDGRGGQSDRVGIARAEDLGDGRCGAADVRTEPVLTGDFKVRPS